jgi:hypothetical protein
MIITPVGPVILPPAQSARCPGCHLEEHRVEACAHCGYRYVNNDPWWAPLAFVVILVGLAIGILWGGIVLMRWLLPITGEGDPTLLQIILDDLRYIASRRLW